jgi:hypothetical protein
VDPTSAQTITQLLLSQGGVVFLLVLILVGGSMKKWVWGWSYEELRKERDEWRTLALEGTTIAERAVTVTEAAASEIVKRR